MLADWAMHCRARAASDGFSRACRRLSNAWALAATTGSSPVACILGGEGGLVGIGRKQARDLRDGGIVAAGAVLGRVADRRRKRAAQGVDDLVVHVPGELEGEVGLGGEMVHWRSMAVSYVDCK
jgi:hypothetical protein